MRREGAAVGVGNDFNGEEGRYPMGTNAGEISKEREAQKKQTTHFSPFFKLFPLFFFLWGDLCDGSHDPPLALIVCLTPASL